jgi:DNA replication and repair protein RecF
VRIHRVLLEDFRSYDRIELELPAAICAFVGANGAGKTNLLEAVYLLATGDSPRAGEDADLVRWGADVARAGVEVDRAGEHRRVETLLFAPRAGERRRARRYLVDGAGKRAEDAVGELAVVAFFPEEVELFSAAPAVRRRAIDATVVQVERPHRRETRQLQRVLEQRNALLRAARDEGEMPAALEMAFWDDELCRLSASVSLRRARAVDALRGPFRCASERFAGGGALEIGYSAQVEGDTADERAVAYRELLETKRERELWQGATLVGPHREDVVVTASGRPLAGMASRGEQRTAVLALKLAEAAWITERSGERPVFLLDEVLSELDPDRRDALVRALPEDGQTLITAASPAGIPPALAQRASVMRVERGAAASSVRPA